MVLRAMRGDCVIGVDLGGTKLLAGVVDAELRVHHRVRRAAQAPDQAALLTTLEQAVREAVDAARGEVSAVGIGIPALLDVERRMVLFSTHLPLEGISLRDVLSERLGLPVFVDNDSDLALLAEQRAGAARDARIALMLTLGTGIGGAVMIDGRSLPGAQGAGRELGHVVVDVDGPPCQGKCPSRGCLEALASGSALVREATRVAGEQPDSSLGRALAHGLGLTGPLVTELAHDGDEAARSVVALIGRRLGTGIAGLVNVFDPDVVVIGGGVVAAGDLLLEPAREEFRARVLPPGRDHVRIVAARFADEAGMLGAALLARGGAADRAAA
jgi:glucokinase